MRDIDIRRALYVEMDRCHGSDPYTRVLDELGLCQGEARVDLAVVNGSVHGYEIKSEHDTLARLPSQTGIYNRALDLVTIVTAREHTKKARAVVPKWWGMWSAAEKHGKVQFRQLRRAKTNPMLDPFAVAQLLWRDEALDALRERGLEKGLLRKPRVALWERLAAEVPVDELRCIVRERLKHRDDWRVPSRPT
jgi:hypothetical protein